jgi:hypothetical protein
MSVKTRPATSVSIWSPPAKRTSGAAGVRIEAYGAKLARLRPAVGQTSVKRRADSQPPFGDEYAHPASWQLALLSSVQATAVLLFRPIVRVAWRCLGLPVA